MNIEIILLGNRGVGKTTMLSVLSHALQENQDRFYPLSFEPCGEEFKQLHDQWKEIIELVDKNYFFTKKYEGTSDIVEHKFEYHDDKGHSLFCNFVDTPGGHTDSGDSSLAKRVAAAKAVICVVDAVDLMEFESIEKSKVLCAEAGIRRLLSSVKGEKPLHCLFVLTKCEKYMHSSIRSQNADALAERFTECFKHVLMLPNLISLYLPIETLGCFEFAGFDSQNPEGRKWEKVRLKHSPKNVCYPLLFIMKELLEDLKDQRGWWEKFCNWLSGNSDFDVYVRKLEELIGDVNELRFFWKKRNRLMKRSDIVRNGKDIKEYL